jgi:hypothetical protein
MCLFYALESVDKGLVLPKLRKNPREEIYKKFQEADYATLEEIIKECEELTKTE